MHSNPGTANHVKLAGGKVGKGAVAMSMVHRLVAGCAADNVTTLA